MQEQARETPVNTETTTPVTPTVEVSGAKPPEGLSPEQQLQLARLADGAVQRFAASKGSEGFGAEEELANVGIKAQRDASGTVDLDMLQERMGRVINGDKDSPTAKVMSDIDKLERALNTINPETIQKETIFQLLGLIPFLGNRWVRVLKTAARRRQTVAEFAAFIEKSLRYGQEQLKIDNAQLKILYQKIEGFQTTVRNNAYLADLIMEKLEKAIAETTEPTEKNRFQNVLFRVSARAQDLRAMEEAFEQAFVGITVIRESNSLLINAIDRMLTLGMQAVQVAFAIAVALAHQRDVMAAHRTTREFVGNILAANAESIKRHVGEIGDIYREPMIAMDRLQKAHNDLITAMDELDKMKAQGIAAAKENMSRLRQMSEELRNRQNAATAAETASLEAELPIRPTVESERPRIA